MTSIFRRKKSKKTAEEIAARSSDRPVNMPLRFNARRGVYETGSGECSCCKSSGRSSRASFWNCKLNELENTARSNCHRCIFVLACINWAIQDRKWFTREEVEELQGNQSDPIKVRLRNPYRLIHLDVFTGSGGELGPLALTRSRRLFPGQTSSEATIQNVKRWIDECVTSHKECRPPVRNGTQASFFPDRILDLHNGQVVLRENLPPTRYACLSHCWGSITDIVKTTAKTLDDFKVQIPWDKLPKTFRDAIDICRRLGVWYLWIDSLCITQDNSAEWAEQAATMGDIYENAFFVLAATKAGDSSRGCYSETQPEYMGSLLPGYKDVYIRKTLPKFPSRWPEREESKETLPLLQRAWVYQETRLSRRVLHFCSEEVVFECENVRHSESGCSYQDLTEYNSTVWNYDVRSYAILAEEPRLLWYRTVQDYSGLSLTFQYERLVALAALTQRMQVLRKDDQFLAGLWKKTLLFDLLWFVWPGPTFGRPPVRNAPTWSWASVNGQVVWQTSEKQTLKPVRVIDIQYRSIGPVHMGDILEAKITLIAPLIPAEGLYSILHDTRYGHGHYPKYIDDWWSYTDELRGNSTKELLQEIRISQTREDLPSKRGDVIDYTDVFIIPIGCTTNEGNASIVVRRKCENNVETYERFSFAWLKHLKAMENPDNVTDRTKHNSLLDDFAKRLQSVLERWPVSTITLI